jgi:hypothetical protein
MKALFILLMALATGAHAQQPTPCLKLKKTEIEKRILHQNGATQATLTFEGKHCYVLNESKNIGRQGPVLEVTPAPGISATVESVGAVLFDPAKVRLADFKGGQIAANLNLVATPEAPLGKHSLQVLMHYQVMDGLGNVRDETLAFGVPVKVAPAEHIRQPGPGFAERHPVWAKVLLPFEIIAMVPLFILAGLMGWDGC